jgi:hypothetical protein
MVNKNGYGYYLTDEEFIAKWKDNPSPSLMSKATGISVRGVQNRRRTIELRHKITLETAVDLRKEHNTKVKELAKVRKEKNQEALKQRLEATSHSVRRGMELDKGRVIIFSDAHFTVICNGDAFDGAVLSRFPSINYDRKPSVLDELNYCKTHLEAIEAVRPAGCRLIWTMGNHDMRYESFLVSRVPEFSGVDNFSLKDHFPNWETCWSFWINDDTVVKHRHKSGRYAGYNNVQASFCNIFTGHTHVLTLSPISTFDQKTYWGVQTGTLADVNSDAFVYCEDNAKDWRQGFIMASWENGKLLMPEMVLVNDEDSVQFRGEILQL